jgi:hypothetical protein
VARAIKAGRKQAEREHEARRQSSRERRRAS